MRNTKTVIVVGAGASREFKMPDGAGLRDYIKAALRLKFATFGPPQGPKQYGTAEAIEALARENSASSKTYESACSQIVEAMPGADSIDDFIDQRRDDPNIAVVGKIAIVDCILKAESMSLLKYPTEAPSKIDLSHVEKSWCMRFARILFGGCQRDELKDRLKNLTLIVFNYDRCIEHFLCNYIQTVYNTDERFAAEVLESLDIFHPYGSVGPLPWQSVRGGVPFGAALLGNQLVNISKSIHTYSEQIQDKETLKRIHLSMNSAKRLMFLGFAFHQQNMKLITPKDISGSARVMGTVFEMPDPTKRAIMSDIRKIGQNDTAILDDSKCAKFLDDYDQLLSP